MYYVKLDNDMYATSNGIFSNPVGVSLAELKIVIDYCLAVGEKYPIITTNYC